MQLNLRGPKISFAVLVAAVLVAPAALAEPWDVAAEAVKSAQALDGDLVVLPAALEEDAGDADAVPSLPEAPSAPDVSPLLNDCEQGGDAGPTFNEARDVAPPVDCKGAFVLADLDEADWYRFDARDGDTLRVGVAPESTLSVRVCTAFKGSLGVSKACTTGAGDGATVVRSDLLGSDAAWAVAIEKVGGVGAYHLQVDLVAGVAQDDCGTGADAGETSDAASAIDAPVQCRGKFRLGDDEDWFAFQAQAGHQIRINLRVPAGADFDVCLFRPSDAWTPVACSAALAGETERIEGVADADGTWLLQVFRFDGFGGYRLRVQAN